MSRHRRLMMIAISPLHRVVVIIIVHVEDDWRSINRALLIVGGLWRRRGRLLGGGGGGGAAAKEGLLLLLDLEGARDRRVDVGGLKRPVGRTLDRLEGPAGDG